ncbi:MAG: bifunctional allantoicase/(S)-ureidoglycine aminohydrolase, partial [Pseudomonadota bacterium]
MTERRYFAPHGGLPSQSQLITDRAVFTDSYAVIPRGVMSDIVTSRLPGWTATRAWILARPLTGFAETFSQMIVEVGPGGGASEHEPHSHAQGAFFVVEGRLSIAIDGQSHVVEPGGFAYLPAGSRAHFQNAENVPARFHWIRKAYEPARGLPAPTAIFSNEREIAPVDMPDTDGAWATTRFMDPEDLSYDMHVTIVTIQPGGVIPFAETHVMEHGLYVLEGKGVYRLNTDWVEVEAGDFMWLRAFCPQACYAGG